MSSCCGGGEGSYCETISTRNRGDLQPNCKLIMNTQSLKKQKKLNPVCWIKCNSALMPKL